MVKVGALLVSIALIGLVACGKAERSAPRVTKVAQRSSTSTQPLSLTVSWLPDADTLVVGYNVYISHTPGSYSNPIQVIHLGNVLSASFPITSNTPYFMTVTAVSPVGAESGPSTEISYIIPDVAISSDGKTATVSYDRANPNPTFPNNVQYNLLYNTDVTQKTWQTDPQTNAVTTPLANGLQRVQVTEPFLSPNRFFRVQIVVNTEPQSAQGKKTAGSI
jgi:hypothetical protein